MMDSIGQQSLFNIMISLMVLVVVWWCVQSFRFDVFVKDPEGIKAKALMVLTTLALTHLVTGFLLNYLNWSTSLRYLF
ncbi:DUF1146 family protein [Alkalicoccus halolimnae]|uniref:DUF1146 family protein n=1 Tax=Alkalicoccus halolimnae TaxID=1667239 RepID=A0A5C7FKY6_9BACI|nr:DUF1146 family protein [Alkalicoccus halolimnae]TXF86974.1 DUF1146 domain-containing protein [Alkalicoccus halolimnae]